MEELVGQVEEKIVAEEEEENLKQKLKEDQYLEDMRKEIIDEQIRLAEMENALLVQQTESEEYQSQFSKGSKDSWASQLSIDRARNAKAQNDGGCCNGPCTIF